MNKYLKKIIKLKFKKIGIMIITFNVIAILASGIVCYTKFNDRFEGWIQQIRTEDSNNENDSTNENYSNENMQKDYRDISKSNQNIEYNNDQNQNEDKDLSELLNLSKADKIIVVIVLMLMAMIGVTYWIFVVLWIIKRAYLDGANFVFFGILAFFFNIFAIIAYYLYKSTKKRCASCGKIQKYEAEYCSGCGIPLSKTCNKCGAKIDKNDNYCTKCGEKQ